ncbi:MAG: HK97 family phage prohead protease [Acidobacteriota bacterium]|nr:HK97 family phage prohead protease [Acidobacteriota bacterium]
MKHLNCPTDFKAIGDAGTFEGYAAIFGNIDLGGDILERGAIKEIATRRNGKVVVLNQHRQSDPIGLADVEQDDKGLKFVGQLVLESPSARSAHALMKSGALDGMSFGYDVLPGGAEILKSGVRKLTAVKLWEISPVTFGMNPSAGIDSVKALVANGHLPSLSDFEDHLREAGFSKSQATAIASHGLKYLHDRSESGGAGVGELQKLLSSFRIPS